MGGEGGGNGLGLSPPSRSRSYMSDPIERVRFRVLGRSWGPDEGARGSAALLTGATREQNTRGRDTQTGNNHVRHKPRIPTIFHQSAEQATQTVQDSVAERSKALE